jgi:plasmid stability protein
MAELILNDVADGVFQQLQVRALQHQRTPADEAKAILTEALHACPAGAWTPVDELYDRLAASGRDFGDSGELLREDRDR